MWIDSKVTIGKQTHSCKLNVGETISEVELPYFEGWEDVDTLEINSKKCEVILSSDLGERNETIIMRCKHERESNKSRKTPNTRG
jgi:hypothetical protein